MDSDRNLNPLLDLIIEAGITGVWPLEVEFSLQRFEEYVEYLKKHLPY